MDNLNTITTVGIVGAGTMGNGIAQACATSGVNAIMVDISDAAVAKGLATVSGSLDRLVKKERSPKPTRPPHWRASRPRPAMKTWPARNW